jgi:hypothetical protein
MINQLAVSAARWQHGSRTSYYVVKVYVIVKNSSITEAREKNNSFGNLRIFENI